MDFERMIAECKERGWLWSINPAERLQGDGHLSFVQWEVEVWNHLDQRYTTKGPDVAKEFESSLRALALIDKRVAAKE